jgi:hypothetical protein
MGLLGRVAWSTWIQGAAAIGTLGAATAAWRATIQVKRNQEREARFRAAEQLKTIHRLINELGQTRAEDPNYGWMGPQLNLRTEIVVLFEPLPICLELAVAEIRNMKTQELYDLVAQAMVEVEAAQRALWKDLAIKTEESPRTWFQRLRRRT